MLASRLEMEGIAVLDLFAGSGSLGLEALSRGAAEATFVENHREALRYLEENTRTLGCAQQVEVIATDALHYLEGTDRQFLVIFADPPYGHAATGSLPDRIFRRGILREGGYLLIEHEPGVVFPESPLYASGPEKRFGQTRVTFFHHPQGAR
jgi:16S rRNA (guanine966-N2)-methyltransferase